MNSPHVYADFNGIEYLDSDKNAAVLHLTGYGTLASLSSLRIRLAEGLTLVFFEPEDIEVEGMAHFDVSRRDPTGRQGAWVARINPNDIRSSQRTDGLIQEHLCFGCGRNLYSYLAAVGRSYKESCPHCGTSVMEPLAPPAD